MGCLLVLGNSPVVAQTAPAVVAVRIEDNELSGFDMTVSNGTAPPEWKRIRFKSTDNADARLTEAYQNLITSYYQQGYVLQAVISGAPLEPGQKVNTLIFVKSAPKT